MTSTVDGAPLFYVVNQHIGWLKQYILGMDESNWRDMRLRAERQLDGLSEEIDKIDAVQRCDAECATPARAMQILKEISELPEDLQFYIASALVSPPSEAGREMPRHAPQTIETAPKDGTHILAWRIPVGIRVTNNTHPPTVVHWFDDPDEPGFYTSVNERAPEHPFNPTHWERLPDPPLALSRPDQGTVAVASAERQTYCTTSGPRWCDSDLNVYGRCGSCPLSSTDRETP